MCSSDLTADGIVVNVGSGVPRRIADVGRDVARAAGEEGIAPDVTGEFRRGDVRHCTADLGRARTLLGFAPRVTWEEGLQELVAWARDTRAVDDFVRADHELRAHRLVSERLGRRQA